MAVLRLARHDTAFLGSSPISGERGTDFQEDVVAATVAVGFTLDQPVDPFLEIRAQCGQRLCARMPAGEGFSRRANRQRGSTPLLMAPSYQSSQLRLA